MLHEAPSTPANKLNNEVRIYEKWVGGTNVEAGGNLWGATRAGNPRPAMAGLPAPGAGAFRRHLYLSDSAAFLALGLFVGARVLGSGPRPANFDGNPNA